jgi:hypothetical protein
LRGMRLPAERNDHRGGGTSLRCRPWTMCAKTHRPGRCQGDLDRCGSKAATGVRRHLVNDRGCSQKKLLPWGIGGIAGLRRRKSRRAARTIPGYSSHGSAPHCRRLAGEHRTDAPSLQGMPGPGNPARRREPLCGWEARAVQTAAPAGSGSSGRRARPCTSVASRLRTARTTAVVPPPGPDRQGRYDKQIRQARPVP